MEWLERLRPAAYEAPDGRRFSFEFVDVEREFRLRGTAFEFVGVQGAYVQRHGHGAKLFPMLCYFSGARYDLEAAAFERALLEDHRVGRLHHPIHGVIPVTALGEVKRSDRIATGANFCVIEVTFWATIERLYPSSQPTAREDILDAIDAANEAMGVYFAAAIELSAVSLREALRASVSDRVRWVAASLAEVSRFDSDVAAQVRASERALLGGMTVLLAHPAMLAVQTAEIMQAPAQATTNFAVALDAYSSVIRSLLTAKSARPWEFGFARGTRRATSARNDVALIDVLALAALGGLCSCATTAEFLARPHALLAATTISALFDDIVAWRDVALPYVEVMDSGEAYDGMHRTLSRTVKYLLEASFTLANERRMVLDRPRALIELTAELYGTVDERLDFMISTNGLTPDEIIEIPAGREIVWYA